MKKLNKEYKPLTMAVFLTVGGLLSGLLWSSLFTANPSGMVQEQRVAESSVFIPRAEGAEIDSAALTPQSAPFIASADSGAKTPPASENMDMLYGEGAFKDPGPATKFTTADITPHTQNSLASGIVYMTSSGDTIASLSAKFNVPIDMIVQFNPLVNFSTLASGIPIIIPGKNNIAG